MSRLLYVWLCCTAVIPSIRRNRPFADAKRTDADSLERALKAGADDQQRTTVASQLKIKSDLAAGISQHMSYFLANEISAEEKQSVQSNTLVSALERHGVSLERQLQWFALSTVHKSGLFEHAVESDRRADEESDEEDGNDASEGPPGDAKARWGKFKKTVESVSMDRKAEKMLDNARITEFMESGVSDVDSINVQQLEEDIAAFRELDTDNSVEHAQGEIEQISGNSTTGVYMSQSDPEAYRKWKKSQPHRRTTWIQKMYDRLRASGGTKALTEMKHLNSKVNKIIDKLTVIKANIQASSAADWETVEAYEKKTPWQQFRGFLSRYMTAASNNMKKLRKRIYNRFKKKLQEDDKKCTKEHQESEKKAMKQAGMTSADKMAEKLNKKSKTTVSQKKIQKLDGDLEKQMKKAEGMMEEKEEANRNSSAQIEGLMGGLKSSGEQMETQAQSGELTGETVDEVGSKIEEVGSLACAEKEWWIVSKLKGLWAWLKKVEYDTYPTMGVRGMGGAASIVGGGFEEVIDFWNKEIGLFAWGSAWAGTSSATAGVGGYAGVSWKGYKLDWNLEEAYQTAVYTTVSGGLGIPGISSLGMGVTTAFDADNSAGTFSKWIPEPQGCNGLVIGWGVSAGPSLPIGVDMGQAIYKMFTSECFGGDNDEWGGIWKFIGMIWLPHCLRCTDPVERFTMDSLRVGIHLASYPVITDLIHSLLAIRVHNMRKAAKVPNCKQANGTWGSCDEYYDPNKPEKERCSSRSTTFRDDPAHLFDLVSKKLTESAKILDELIDEYDKLLKKVHEAMKVNAQVLNSKEMGDFVKVMRENDVGCLRAPRESTMDFTNGGVAWQEDEFYNPTRLNTLSWDRLKKLCKNNKYCKQNFKITCKTMLGGVKAGCKEESKSVLVDKLMKSFYMATGRHPFGTCSNDKQCSAAAMQSPSIQPLKGHMSNQSLKFMSNQYKCQCPHVNIWECAADKYTFGCTEKCAGIRGVCACDKGWCYQDRPGERGKSCYKDQIGATMLGLKGLRSTLLDWVRAREFELGNAARYLKTLAGSDAKAEDLGMFAE